MAYYSKRCKYDGIDFDSEMERDYYILLKDLKRQGIIKDFEMQIEITLFEESIDFNGKKMKPILHKPDFKVFLNNDTWILIDTKGQQEELATLKRKIFMIQNPGVRYYFVSRTTKYLGDKWVEVSKGYDFRKKLKGKYTKLNGKWSRNKPNWSIEDWDKYFEYENINGLFYRWKKTKRVKK